MMSTVTTAQDPQWITPEQQLERFAALTPEFRAIDALEILQLNNVTGIVVSYLESNLFSWYTVLKKLNMLPKKMPPAPVAMLQLLSSPSSQRICAEQKPDGSAYTIAETCVISLALRELGTVYEMEATFKAYGDSIYSADKNPLQFRRFWELAREEHGNVSPKATHWLVQTKTVLENSRNKTTKKQEDLVAELAKETGQDWQFSEIRGTSFTIFSSRVAPGETLYGEATAANGYVATYTRVKQKTEGDILCVGASADSGVGCGSYGCDNVHLGVGAKREFFLDTCDLDN